jgi:hypothetical protein
MVPAQFNEALVEGVGDDIVVVLAGPERPVEDGLQLERLAHASKFEVPEPQLRMREAGVEPVLVEEVGRNVSHQVIGLVGKALRCRRVDGRVPFRGKI